MKELSELLTTVAEASSGKNIKTAAGIGAGVGAALGLKHNDMIKSAVVGAGIGAALAWAAAELGQGMNSDEKSAAETESRNNSQTGER